MVAYFANALLPQASWGETAVKASPWYYYFSSDPLANGPDFVHLAVLAAPRRGRGRPPPSGSTTGATSPPDERYSLQNAAGS
jgi:hypothetical protein